MATRRKSKSKLSPVARETRASRDTRITDEDVNAAFSIIVRDYWQDVHGIGDELKEQIESGEIDSEDKFDTYARQSVDGAARVIYTHQAKLGLCCTNNPDAYAEYGEVPLTGGGIDWTVMMYSAMLQDVLEYVGSVDFDD